MKGYNGFWGRILEVDLSNGRSRVVDVKPFIFRRFIGGRGLAAWILWRDLGSNWENIDPLGPENILLILTGPLTGYYPGIKLTVSGKSPQSNGVVGSTVSSEVAVELKAAGYDGIMVRGASRDPVYLYVEDDRVEVRDASKLWGKTGLELLKTLREDLREDYNLKGATPWPPVLYIGPAGENRVRTAAVMSKWAHAAGYGGYGAVMGSKNLKAVVVRGTGPLPRVVDPDRFFELYRKATRYTLESKTLKEWGTANGFFTVGYALSSEPVKNWQEEWHDKKEFSVAVAEKRLWVKRYWADWNCPLSCMKVSLVEANGKPYVTDGPDYEMGAYLGTNLGIFDVKKAAVLSAMADDLGLCGIQTGNVMGLAFELYEKGILTREDVGYELKWGNFNAACRLLEDIAYRRGIGDILAEGTYRAALRIAEMKGLKPEDVLKYAVQVKGIGVGAHGIRSKADYPQPIAYAASVQGGDHTSTAGLPLNSRESESWSAFIDSAVVCMFNTFRVPEELIIDMLNTVTGWNVTKEEVYNEIGPRILTIQRVLLLLGGPDAYWDPRIHDDNPPRFYEPLPTGPYAGQKADPSEVRELKLKYYSELGWDQLGVPTRDTLKKLGLTDLIPAIERIKKRLEQQ